MNKFKKTHGYGKNLYRNKKAGKIAGVCAGIADYFEVDVLLIRIIAVISLLACTSLAFIAYWIAYFMLADKPDETELRDQHISDYVSQYANLPPEEALISGKARMRELEKRLRRLEKYITSSRFELDQGFKNLSD